MTLGGPTRQRQVGGIIYAENDFCRMAYVYTDDPAKVGKLGWVWNGEDEVCVEYVARPIEEAME